MNTQYRGCVLAAGMAAFFTASAAQAALLTRLGGLAVYDTELGITWLTDANAGAGSAFDDGSNTVDGRMSWVNANNWAASLTIGGVSGWRLATMDADGDGTVVDCATAAATACQDNEYGYHFHQNGIDTANPGPFSNIMTNNYWSSTESDAGSAWLFDFNLNDGSQLATSKNYNGYAWAVYDGDVAAVPVPAAVWLFGSGLLALLGLRGKRA